jgi:hypothetical protein
MKGAFGVHEGKLLTQEQVDELEEGTWVLITWSGGNGPHNYRITVDNNGNRYACGADYFDTPEDPLRFYNPIDFVGHERFHTWASLTEPQHAST